MRRLRTTVAAGLAVALGMAGVAGFALTSSDPDRTYSPGVRVGVAPLAVRCGERLLELPARWSFPAGDARGLVWLQHGFARSGDRMADLADRLAADGMLVVAPTANALGDCSLSSPHDLLRGIAAVLRGSADSGGALTVSMRAAAAGRGIAPAGVPAALVLAGHSAGAAAMTGVAAALVEPGDVGVDRLRLLLLLDPVESRAGVIGESIGTLAEVEVLTIAGEPGPCNADGSGPAVLGDRRDGFLGVRLAGGCHCDAEGASTNAACTIVCGASDPDDVATLQSLARGWVADAVDGSRRSDFYPGGTALQRLMDERAIALLGE